MKQSKEKLTENERKFLFSLLRDGHKTDAEISREIKLSKASVGRIRKRLEEDKIIVDYIPIVNLDAYGINLYAVVSFEWRGISNPALTKKLEEEFVSTPQVLYFASGESSHNLNYVSMFGFFNISDFHDFFNEFRKKYGENIGQVETFFIPANNVIKQDFTGLAKLVIERGGGK